MGRHFQGRDSTRHHWRDRLNYCIQPPGWSHDGSRDTSETIKRKHLAKHPEDANTPGFNTLG